MLNYGEIYIVNILIHTKGFNTVNDYKRIRLVNEKNACIDGDNHLLFL